jgi:hypothetical protein
MVWFLISHPQVVERPCKGCHRTAAKNCTLGFCRPCCKGPCALHSPPESDVADSSKGGGSAKKRGRSPVARASLYNRLGFEGASWCKTQGKSFWGPPWEIQIKNLSGMPPIPDPSSLTKSTATTHGRSRLKPVGQVPVASRLRWNLIGTWHGRSRPKPVRIVPSQGLKA